MRHALVVALLLISCHGGLTEYQKKCLELSSEKKCLKDRSCKWDLTYKECIPNHVDDDLKDLHNSNEPAAKAHEIRPCHERKSRNDCVHAKKVKGSGDVKVCEWKVDSSGDPEKDQCVEKGVVKQKDEVCLKAPVTNSWEKCQQSVAQQCSSFKPGCVWNPEYEQCLSEMSNVCGYPDEKSCSKHGIYCEWKEVESVPQCKPRTLDIPCFLPAQTQPHFEVWEYFKMYDFSEDFKLEHCTLGDCSHPQVTPPITCRKGYDGDVKIEGCHVTRFVTLSGCKPNTRCLYPEDETEGYMFELKSEIPDCGSVDCEEPNLEGLSCASGYKGEPAIKEWCQLDKPYATLTGCVPEDACTELPENTVPDNSRNNACGKSVKSDTHCDVKCKPHPAYKSGSFDQVETVQITCDDGKFKEGGAVCVNKLPCRRLPPDTVGDPTDGNACGHYVESNSECDVRCRDGYKGLVDGPKRVKCYDGKYNTEPVCRKADAQSSSNLQSKSLLSASKKVLEAKTIKLAESKKTPKFSKAKAPKKHHEVSVACETPATSMGLSSLMFAVGGTVFGFLLSECRRRDVGDSYYVLQGEEGL